MADLIWKTYISQAYVLSKAYDKSKGGFTVKQACMSGEAESRGYANKPDDTHLFRLKETLRMANKIVKKFEETYTDYGVWIESGYRSPCVNQAVGGAKNSGHKEGGAVDLKVYRKDNKKTTNTYLKDNPHELLIKTAAEVLQNEKCNFDELLREVVNGGYWMHLAIYGAWGRQRAKIRTVTTKGATKLPANYMKWSYKNLQVLIDSIK